MRFIKLLCPLFLLWFIVGCDEDTIEILGEGKITGTVVKEGSNDPVENVKISTNPSTSTVFSDSNGDFTLRDIPVGDYSIQAKKDGFITQFEGASVRANAEVNVVFELLNETSGNKQPSSPKLIAPSNDAEALDLDIQFQWKSNDPENDELTYELEIKNDKNNEVLRFSEIQDTMYVVENLKYSYKYFWQVKVSDSINPTVFSEVNSFTTKPAPSGNNYLFVREIKGNNVIFSSDGDNNEIRLTEESSNSFRPRKNLDVNRVAYYKNFNGETHLFTMDMDGSNQKQITHDIPANGINMGRLGLSWANNGRSLLYPNFNKLYRINTDGSGNTLMYKAPTGRYILDIQESNDQSKILVLETNLEGYDGSLYVLNKSGKKISTIIQNSQGTLGGIDISVDNKYYLYTRDVSGYENVDGRLINSKIFIYNNESKETVNLSGDKPNGTNDTDPRFSPNEASVIFVNGSNESGSAKSIFTLTYNEDLGSVSSSREVLIENAKMPDWE